MSQLLDTVQDPQGEANQPLPMGLSDANYQSNMYLIERALQETGAEQPSAPIEFSVYDTALARLIDAVPLE